MRLALTQWLAVSVSVLNTTYSAPAAGTQLGLLQNLTLFTLGVSVFLPARSDGGAS
ncbi:MAG: hypothetical protein IPJ65_37855 [Archangiaceae bacterium]|nr:hypothetical protein [Archangiaceae bacterium]